MEWNPELYQSAHSFVWELGRDLLGMLAPQAGERILDVGCGTGQLTAEIARSGAEVVGIDNSASMIERARANFPDVTFQVADATSMPFERDFDAVFSNAALHWIPDADAAAAAISRALRPGGRFVAEFGGRGNIRTLHEVVYKALASIGACNPERLNPWFFPGIAEYAGTLERHGLEVTYAVLFDRPTRLDGGGQELADWLAMFGGPFSAGLDPEQRREFERAAFRLAEPRLLRDGAWTVDYRRLRVFALRPGLKRRSTYLGSSALTGG